MKTQELGTECILEKVEWTILPGERYRSAGRNARLPVHGKTVGVALARITAGGIQGFGWAYLPSPGSTTTTLVGTPLREMFSREAALKVLPQYRQLEFPLLDWWGKANRLPVFRCLTSSASADEEEDSQAETSRADREQDSEGLRVPCYDTSLYFDDLDLAETEAGDKAAVELLQAEALEGWARGHRAFKIKVGRGARFMPQEAGILRDAAIVNGIRQVVGPAAPLMVDANNGFNLNLAKEFLSLTREANLFWLEEPFHEDPVLFGALKEWLVQEKLRVMLADGEGRADPRLLEWAKAGLVDVIQYDLREYGFGNWLELGAILDAANLKSAPHNYGGLYGNYASAHLAPAIKGFLFVEWDGGQAEGLDTSAYQIEEGQVIVPEQPGFGLELDEPYFSQKVKAEGWTISA